MRGDTAGADRFAERTETVAVVAIDGESLRLEDVVAVARGLATVEPGAVRRAPRRIAPASTWSGCWPRTRWCTA